MPLSQLITDRTIEDVEYVKTLLSVGFEGMTSEQQSSWLANLKGAYNYSDLNRVGTAVNYLVELLNQLPQEMKEFLDALLVDMGSFFMVPYTTPINVTAKIDWNFLDVPSEEELEEYLSNVQTVSNTFLSSVDLPNSMEGLNYIGANNIENVLIELYETYKEWEEEKKQYAINASKAWFYSGEIYAGEV